MAAEATRAEGAVFLDTSVLVPATVEAHPAHTVASRWIEHAGTGGLELCISPQVCREFLVVLTRQPVSDRVFSHVEALGALNAWRTGCRILDEGTAVLEQLVRLVEQHGVRGKQVHDCNIVATMLVHGVQRLVTRNSVDFRRYAGLIQPFQGAKCLKLRREIVHGECLPVTGRHVDG